MTAAYPYREIIELASTGISRAKVGYLCGCGEVKVKDVLERAAAVGLAWPVPPELTDAEIERLVGPLEDVRRFAPDFEWLEAKIGHALNEEDAESAYDIYVSSAVAAGEEPYVASTFSAKLRDWVVSRHPKPTMLVNWHAAESAQIDWAGRSLTLYGPRGGQTPVYLFVATLPYSCYTFVRASLDMGMQSWLEHNVAMLEFFGGAPLFAAIDNLACGVTFKGSERVINQHYAEFAEHYGMAVLPARVKVPTDKGQVEGHVKIMANGIVGVLESMRFTSIEQLNEAVTKLVAIYNDRPLAYAHGRSRRQIFLAEEASELQPLPVVPFEAATWSKRSVADDAVVRVRGNFYGVPAQYAGMKVEARVSAGEVRIFTQGRRQCIACHKRREDGAETFEGLAGVRPERFMPLDEWAEAFGHPLLMAQWDAEANAPMGIHDVVCRSKKEVSWRCLECGFSWSEAVCNRTQRSFDECPVCSGTELVEGVNDLATTHPEIAAEWSDRNPMPASRVFPDFRMRFWWRGRCGHEWRESPAMRTGSAVGALCPYCSGRDGMAGVNDVASLAPELAVLWHPTKNRNRKPETTSVCSYREVYLWNGALSHIWRQSPRSWLAAHGMEGVLEPFDLMVREARETDEADRREDEDRGHASSRWNRFVTASELRVSFQRFCEEFGHDDLLAEWDAERNGDLKPEDVTRASTRIVWWRGTCGHAWQESVRSRVFGKGTCPKCAVRAVEPGYNDVKCLEAGLPRMWHPVKNGSLVPEEVSDRSATKVWWQCPTCGFDWRETLRLTHYMARKCPACEGRRRRGFLVPKLNALAAVRPDLAAQWHPTLNGDLDVSEAYKGSRKVVWWLGPCGHAWRESIACRVDRHDLSCPYCANRRVLSGINDIASVHPELAAQWHQSKNGALLPSQVRFNSTKAVWGKGPCGHEWDSTPERRHRGEECPICANRRVLEGFNDLASQRPDIAAQWHPTLNGNLQPKDVTTGSGKNIWWICDGGHAWQRHVANRTSDKDVGCPYCHGTMVLAGFNDLATTHRKIARQFHPTKNGELKASDVMAKNTGKVWWKCRQGHEWQASPRSRTQDAKHDPGCPYCANRKAWPGDNDLGTVAPDIAALWHPHMNRKITPRDVTAHSGKVVWWKGSTCGHSFKMKVSQRAKASSGYCPICAGRLKPERQIKGLRAEESLEGG